MSAMYLLIGFSLIVAVGFLIAFLWAIRNGQYEDDYTPSVRMLFEDGVPDSQSKEHASERHSS
jgi:cbb3-type cytochrome oxidase maturation protein